MSISLAESQAINEIARHLYNFLPGNPHPFADQTISFRGVADKVGVGNYWSGGSKLPSLTRLLQQTLESRRNRFCDLILEIVRGGLIYRNKKSDPIKRDDIRKLNELLMKVHFKVPDLWDPVFLDSLPVDKTNRTIVEEKTIVEKTKCLKDELLNLSKLDPQPRGFAFEKFLNRLFEANELSPRGPFKLAGEQIDGSFQLGQDTYLLEAKWQNKPVGQADLLVLYSRVNGKSTWSRGIFISHSGFSEDGINAYSRGRATNMIGLTGQDLYYILEGSISLREAIKKKVRRAAEEGEFYISAFDLIHEC